MKLRRFESATDFDKIKDWIGDERIHAMWCANRFSYPLEKDNLTSVLNEMGEMYGETPFLALTDDGNAAGFFCYSLNKETMEGMLKFIVVNPELRGKGIAGQMLKAASEYAFDETGAELVHLNVFPENVRAKKCYLNAGFTERDTTANAFTYKDESWSRCNMILRKG